MSLHNPYATYRERLKEAYRGGCDAARFLEDRQLSAGINHHHKATLTEIRCFRTAFIRSRDYAGIGDRLQYRAARAVLVFLRSDRGHPLAGPIGRLP